MAQGIIYHSGHPPPAFFHLLGANSFPSREDFLYHRRAVYTQTLKGQCRWKIGIHNMVHSVVQLFPLQRGTRVRTLEELLELQNKPPCLELNFYSFPLQRSTRVKTWRSCWSYRIKPQMELNFSYFSLQRSTRVRTQRGCWSYRTKPQSGT